MMTEKRRNKPRYEIVPDGSVEVLVRRKSDEFDEAIQGNLNNLSSGGAQILLPIYPKFSEKLDLRIHIPAAKITIEATAEVIWIRPVEDDQCLVGCSFAKTLSESALDSLAKARISNRRRHPRYEVNIPGFARWELDADSIPVRITDYSKGGFCMVCGRSSTEGAAVSVELDARDDVVPPILGKVCWQRERDGEYIIGCSLKRIEDFEPLHRLGNMSGDEHRTTSSSFGQQTTSSSFQQQTNLTWFRAPMWVFVLFGSTLLASKAVESWLSPPTKVWLADTERNSVALAVRSETDSATADPNHRVDHRESTKLEGKTDQIDSDVFGIGNHATQETTSQKLNFVPHTIGDTVGLQLVGDVVVSKTVLEQAMGTHDKFVAPGSEPRLKSTRPSASKVNSSVSEEDSDAEREAVAALKKLGAQIRGGYSVTLTNNTTITDADLRHLKKMTSLRRLLLDGTKVTDAGLEPLRRLAGLEDLRIHQTSVTDNGLDHLKGLTNLKLLFLPAKTTDAGLEHLKNLTAMENLGLRRTQVTGRGLQHVKGMTNLEWLWLKKTKVSDASLAHLKELHTLTMLELDDTQVSDAGLVHLQGMKTLKELYLRNTKVTQEGIDKLKEALPDCKIE